MASKRLALTLLWAAALTTSIAHAQPSPAERDAARALMGVGEEQRDRGDLEGALKSFQGADAIMHVPTTGLEVAKTEAQLGRLLEAKEVLLAILRAPARHNEPRPFAAARENAKTLDEELERRIPVIVIQLTGAPANSAALVTLDGAPLAATSLGAGRKVNPGHHVLAAQAGDTSASAELDVAERETKAVTLKLVSPERAAAPVAPEPSLPPKQDENPRKANYVAYTGFGVGAVGLAVGAVAGIIVLANSGDLKDACNKPAMGSNTCTGADADKLSSTKTWATVSTVSFIVGGAGIAVGTLALVLGKSDPAKRVPTSGRTIEPWIGVGSAGLSGRF